ncbi:MAG TPA: tetratricopeptide repeat protein, partial [Bryobacteraceae bacterium]|nr:tetratricopeptide repeat protein [Bryobacteraceae bacterium]
GAAPPAARLPSGLRLLYAYYLARFSPGETGQNFWRCPNPMQPVLRKFLLALPASLLVSALCWGQTTAITGNVKGLDGKPVKGAVIKIVRTDIKGNYTVKTDKKGHYYYGGLGLGMYNVSVEVDGKEADAVQGVNTARVGTAEVDFDLKAAAARRAGAPQEDADAERGMTPQQKAEYEKKKKDAEARMAKDKALNDAFNAGREAETAKNWDVAIQQFEKASQLDPAQHVVWSHLADAYISRGNGKNGAEQAADYQKGIDNYQKAIALSPSDPAYHNNYALVLAKDKKLDEAKTELTKAAQLDPTQAGKYYYNLGAVLVNTGQMDQAAEAFQTAISKDPNYADAYYQYGIVLMGKATTSADGKITPPPGTVEAFQKYLSLQPTGPNAEPAKAMLASLGSSVSTSFDKKKKK